VFSSPSRLLLRLAALRALLSHAEQTGRGPPALCNTTTDGGGGGRGSVFIPSMCIDVAESVEREIR